MFYEWRDFGTEKKNCSSYAHASEANMLIKGKFTPLESEANF